jgi:UMF1 family MFS transporter
MFYYYPSSVNYPSSSRIDEAIHSRSMHYMQPAPPPVGGVGQPVWLPKAVVKMNEGAGQPAPLPEAVVKMNEGAGVNPMSASNLEQQSAAAEQPSAMQRLGSEWREKFGEASERFAWYMYDAANSVYGNSGALFIPLLINSMAGKAAQGNTIPTCVRTCKDSVCEAPAGHDTCRACVVGVGPMLWTDSTQTLSEFTETVTVAFFGQRESVSVALTATGISVFFQAITMITFGAWADYYDYRKKGLMVSTVVGCLLTMAYIVLDDPTSYLAASWLFIFVQSAYGLCIVYYNAFLPVLVQDHPDVKTAAPSRKDGISEDITNYMSGIGFAFGYFGQMVTLIISAVVMVAMTNSSNFIAERAAILLSGICWALLSLWTFKYLKPHPGRHLGAGEALWSKGWTSTASTLASIRAFPETAKFFVAYFLYSDSYSTMASVGMLIFNELLCIPISMLIIVFIEVMIVAIVGNILALYVQRRFQLQTKSMILGCLGIYLFISVWGMFGIIPNSSFGLRSEWEAFVFGALHGLALGPVQSYTRSMFADLLIPGKEAEFFALYEISDKGSSWMGPIVVSEIITATGRHHLGFIYLAFMITIPALLLASVNHEKGRAEVQAMGHESAQDSEAQS